MAKHKKTARRRKPTTHLPKVGTPANDAYRLEHSRRDLVDFGLTGSKKGPANWVIATVVVVLMVLGTIGLLLLM